MFLEDVEDDDDSRESVMPVELFIDIINKNKSGGGCECVSGKPLISSFNFNINIQGHDSIESVDIPCYLN